MDIQNPDMYNTSEKWYETKSDKSNYKYCSIINEEFWLESQGCCQVFTLFLVCCICYMVLNQMKGWMIQHISLQLQVMKYN